MTRAAATKHDDADGFDLSRARLVRRGPRRDRPVRMTLRAQRVAAGKTQVDVAESTGMDQSDVSKLEQREDLDETMVSTLRRYIEALGGKLELVAVFPKGHRIAIVSVPPGNPRTRGGA
jgi:Helix-turn-helix domain